MTTLYRSTKGNYVLYQPDGRGRDGYIMYNDGGFWKFAGKNIQRKPDYERRTYSNFHSLTHFPAPFHYPPDGTGRDFYIIRGTGLTKHFDSLAQYKLEDFLRTPEADANCFTRRLSKPKNRYINPMDKIIAANVTDRLYTQYQAKRKKKLEEEQLYKQQLCKTQRNTNTFNIDVRKSMPLCNCNYPRYNKELNSKERLFTESYVKVFNDKAKQVENYEFDKKESIKTHRKNFTFTYQPSQTVTSLPTRKFKFNKIKIVGKNKEMDKSNAV